MSSNDQRGPLAGSGCVGLQFDYEGFGAQSRNSDVAMCVEKADRQELVGFWEATFFVLRANLQGAAHVWRTQFSQWHQTGANPRPEAAFFAGYARPVCQGQIGHREIWQLFNADDGAKIEVSFFLDAQGGPIAALMIGMRDDDREAAENARQILSRVQVNTGRLAAGEEFEGFDDLQNARYVITPLAAEGGLL